MRSSSRRSCRSRHFSLLLVLYLLHLFHLRRPFRSLHVSLCPPPLSPPPRREEFFDDSESKRPYLPCKDYRYAPTNWPCKSYRHKTPTTGGAGTLTGDKARRHDIQAQVRGSVRGARGSWIPLYPSCLAIPSPLLHPLSRLSLSHRPRTHSPSLNSPHPHQAAQLCRPVGALQTLRPSPLE